MLMRYAKLIEHGDPLVEMINLLIHISLPPPDVLACYARFIRHRKPTKLT